MSSLLDGLSDQPPGRLEKKEAPARAVFEKQMADLRRENEILEQKLILKDLAFDFRIRSENDRKKKNEPIKHMVTQIDNLKTQYGVPAGSLVSMVCVSLPSYMRWKRRILNGRDPVQKPGAKKVHPIDLDALKQRLEELPHGSMQPSPTVNWPSRWTTLPVL